MLYSPITPDSILVICFVITCDTSSIIGRISIVSLDEEDALDDVDDGIPFIMVELCCILYILMYLFQFSRYSNSKSMERTYLERYIKLRVCITVLRMSAAAPAPAAPVPPPAVLDTMVKVIMSQTEMTHERVVSELERTNYDLKRVIREYMRGDDAVVSISNAASSAASSSTNQLRFSEIRNFMDKSSEMYYRRQEMEKGYNEALEKNKQAALAAAAAAADTTSKL